MSRYSKLLRRRPARVAAVVSRRFILPQPIVNELRQAAGESVRLTAETTVGIGSKSRAVFLPVDISQALEFKSQHPDARIVNGATDVGVLTNKAVITPDVVLSLVQGRGLRMLSNLRNLRLD